DGGGDGQLEVALVLVAGVALHLRPGGEGLVERVEVAHDEVGHAAGGQDGGGPGVGRHDEVGPQAVDQLRRRGVAAGDDEGAPTRPSARTRTGASRAVMRAEGPRYDRL